MSDVLFSTKSIDDRTKEKIQNSLESIYECLIFFTSPTLILFYKQQFISKTKYEKASWTVAYKTEWVYFQMSQLD